MYNVYVCRPNIIIMFVYRWHRWSGFISSGPRTRSDSEAHLREGGAAFGSAGGAPRQIRPLVVQHRRRSQTAAQGLIYSILNKSNYFNVVKIFYIFEIIEKIFETIERNLNSRDCAFYFFPAPSMGSELISPSYSLRWEVNYKIIS